MLHIGYALRKCLKSSFTHHVSVYSLIGGLFLSSFAVPSNAATTRASLTQVQVSNTASNTCALVPGSPVTCWGDAIWNDLNIPTVPGKALASGAGHTCMIDMTNLVTCWGINPNNQLNVPNDLGEVKAVSAWNVDTCAISSTDLVRCWGWNSHGEDNVPSDLGEVTSVSAGRYTSCAIRKLGELICWGQGYSTRLADVPALAMYPKQVSVGEYNACVVTQADDVICWGGDASINSLPTFGDRVAKVLVGNTACALLVNGEVTCWGNPLTGGVVDRAPGNSSLNFTDISIGIHDACGVTDSQKIHCWGDDAVGQTDVPLGFAIRESSEVGRAPSGVVVANHEGEGNLAVYWYPSGYIIDRVAGDNTATSFDVYVTPGGKVCTTTSYHCVVTDLQADTDYTVNVVAHYPSGADGVSKSVGPMQTYAIPANGCVVNSSLSGKDISQCLVTNAKIGRPFGGSANNANFDNVVVIGEKETDSIDWPGRSMSGNSFRGAFLENIDMRTNMSGLDFTGATLQNLAIAAGGINGSLANANLSNATLRNLDLSSTNLSGATLTGIEYDSSVIWPNGFTPPASTTHESTESLRTMANLTDGKISAAGDTSCLVRPNGHVACWGIDTYGIVSGAPTSGTFESVSVGFDHACAINTSQLLTCWGTNTYAQSSVPSDLGSVDSVATPYGATCALVHSTNAIHCWGDDTNQLVTNAYTGTDATSLAGGDAHACAILSSGSVNCWGLSDAATRIGGEVAIVNADFINAGRAVTCATSHDVLHCWGYGDGRIGTGNFQTDVLRGAVGNSPCWISNSGIVTCTGTYSAGNPKLSKQAIQISVGDAHACALLVDESVECWGSNTSGQLNIPRDPVAPTAPVITLIAPADGQGVVSFTSPSDDGGAPITDYEYSTDSGTTWTSAGSTSSPLMISGLSNGQSYDVIIRALNAIGSGPASDAVSVTPFGLVPDCVTVPSRCTITVDDTTQVFSWVAPEGPRQIHVQLVGGTGGDDLRGNVPDRAHTLDFDLNYGSADSVSTRTIQIGVGEGGVSGVHACPDNWHGVAAKNPFGRFYGGPGRAWCYPSAGASGAAGTAIISKDVTYVAAGTGGGSSSQGPSWWDYDAGPRDWGVGDPRADDTNGYGFVQGGGGGILGGTGGGWKAGASGLSGSIPTQQGLVEGSTPSTPGAHGRVVLWWSNSSTPLAPEITSVVVGNHQASINFSSPLDDGGSGITDYEYSTDSGTTWTSAGSITSPITISGLTNGTTYSVKLRAVNALGSGASSSAASFTPATVPNVPTTPIVTKTSRASLDVSWSAPSNNGGSIISSYKVEYSSDGGQTWTSTEVPSPIQRPDTNHYYLPVSTLMTWNEAQTYAPSKIFGGVRGHLVAINDAAENSYVAALAASYTWIGFDRGAGTWVGTDQPVTFSNWYPGEPTGDGPCVSTNFTIRPTNWSNHSGQWNDADCSTQYGFTIEWDSVDVANPDTTFADVTTSLTGLSTGSTYLARVSALNSQGQSEWANSSSVLLAEAPGAPTISSIAAGNRTATVYFAPPSDDGGASITDYQYSTNGGLSWASAGTTTSPITITGLTNGTTYSVKLRAVNAAGSGAASNAVDVTPRTTASAPTVSSVTPGKHQATIVFMGPSDNGGAAITNYEYSTDGGTSWTPVSPSQTSSPIVVTGLLNGSTYSVKLRAVNIAGSGTASNALSVSLPATAPEQVTGLVLTSRTGTSLNVSWSAPVANGSAITNYVVARSTNGTTWTTVTHPVSTATSLNITGLTQGTSYQIRVSAVNARGTGPTSAVLTAIPSVAPSTPAAPTIGVKTTSSVALSWTAPSNGGQAITGYQVRYSSNAGTTWSNAIATGSATASYTVTGLTTGSSYVFQTAAINPIGTSAWSASSASALVAGVPGQVTALTVTGKASTSVSLSWTAPATNGSAISTYTVQYSTNGTTWTTFTHTASTATTITVTGLTQGTAYQLRVSAVNAVGTGTASSTVSATPSTTPAAPGKPTRSARGTTTATIAWSAPTNTGGAAVTSYAIRYSSNNGTTWSTTIVTGTTALTYQVTGLTSGTTYVFQVAAINSNGQGTWSASSNAI